MGKRGQDFPKRKNDAYDTPEAALAPLLSHLPAVFSFIEPCAGKGDLARFIHCSDRYCGGLFDIKPRSSFVETVSGVLGIERGNAATFRLADPRSNPREMHGRFFITNPPWTWELLVPIILNLYWQRPTWLLLSADLIHNERFSFLEPICKRIVSVGRVRWMEGQEGDQGHTSYDNAAWYLFDGEGRHPIICGRR